jgi:hypothetical protein
VIAIWSWLVGLLGLGRLVAVLAAAGALLAGAVGFYVKGRMDCVSKYELAQRDATIAHLNDQIANLQDAEAHSGELYREYVQFEEHNNEVEARLLARPVDGCIDADWLRDLANIE